MNNPRVGPNHYMLANPEGPLMTTSCKEKEAAWEFMKFIASGDALLLYTAKRMVPPVRKSFFNNPAFENNRFIKMSLAESNTWYMPPYYAQELGELPGQDPAVLAGDAAPEDHGARIPRAGREVPARPGVGQEEST